MTIQKFRKRVAIFGGLLIISETIVVAEPFARGVCFYAAGGIAIFSIFALLYTVLSIKTIEREK